MNNHPITMQVGTGWVIWEWILVKLNKQIIMAQLPIIHGVIKLIIHPKNMIDHNSYKLYLSYKKRSFKMSGVCHC